MFRAMLCGASDTQPIAADFRDAVRRAGGDPWYFRDGHLLYLNTTRADFRRNSVTSVRASDLLVFVIMRDYGRIAWETELHAALDDGKPVVILCLSDTYRAYLRRVGVRDGEQPGTRLADPLDAAIVDLLNSLEVDRALTIVPFSIDSFPDILTRELARTFHLGLGALAERSRREALSVLLREPTSLTGHDLQVAELVALDEFEDKRLRKQAVIALAGHGVSADVIGDLARSSEQGVARLAIDRLAELHPTRPPNFGLIEELVEICNESDDVGLGRRLVTVLFEIDPLLAVRVLTNLAITEIGLRRRIACAIDEHLQTLLGGDLLVEALELLRRCLAKQAESPWLARTRELVQQLEGQDDPAPST